MIKQLLLAVIILALIPGCKKNEPGLPGIWEQKANLPLTPGRTGAVSFAIGGNGYFVGGSDDPVYHNDIYAYDPVTDEWTQRTSCPGNHFLFPVCFVIHDIAYIGICQTDTGYTKEFWSYDPAADSWSRKTDFPGTAPLSAAPNFAIGDYGYVVGDNGNDFWMYDPVTDKWTQKNNVPVGVTNQYPANFVIGKKGYTGAGTIGNQIWEYDPVQDSWSRKSDLPISGFGLVGSSLNGFGYFFAFDKGNSYMYNPISNSWKSVSFYGNRSFGTAFTLNSKIYYACGGNGQDGLLNDFWEFTPQ